MKPNWKPLSTVEKAADEIRDLADPSQLARRAIGLETRRRRELDDLAYVASTAEGRRFLVRLLRGCEVFDDGYRSTLEEMSRLAGRRQVGIEVLKDLRTVAPGVAQEVIDVADPVEEEDGR